MYKRLDQIGKHASFDFPQLEANFIDSDRQQGFEFVLLAEADLYICAFLEDISEKSRENHVIVHLYAWTIRRHVLQSCKRMTESKDA